VHKSLVGHAPAYITDLVTSAAINPLRSSLRSSITSA